VVHRFPVVRGQRGGGGHGGEKMKGWRGEDEGMEGRRLTRRGRRDGVLISPPRPLSGSARQRD